MKNKLEDFIFCIKSVDQLKKKFLECKSLEESYEKFKFMLGNYTFEEYKSFFESLMNKTDKLSLEDLTDVSGGVSLRSIITPVAIVSMLMGNSVPLMAYDTDESVSNVALSSASDDASFRDFVTETQEPDSLIQLDLADNAASFVDSDDFRLIDAITGSPESIEPDISDTWKVPDVGTSRGEMEFCIKMLHGMPKRGEAGFEEFLKLPNLAKLNEHRTVHVMYRDGQTEEKTFNEREIYREIEKTVREIIEKVDARTPDTNMSEAEIELKIANGEISKHYKMPREMRIAKAIYRWAVKNIAIDKSSIVTAGEDAKYRKGQDAIAVFYHKMAVCQGYSRLITLMMKMAGIPCVNITSNGSAIDEGSTQQHAYNVVYLPDVRTGTSEWTLMDVCWSAQSFQEKIDSPMDVKFFFPAFYGDFSNIDDANRSILGLETHKISDISSGTDVYGNWDDEYYYSFKLNGVHYYLAGSDRSALIVISGPYNNPLENVVIPKEITDLGLPFRIGFYIKSINFTGNEHLVGTVTFSKEDPLPTIRFGDISCELGLKYPKIFGNTESPLENVVIPQTLKELSGSIKIGQGIKSLILTGDESIDIRNAADLESIDTSYSSIYYSFEGGKLYYRNPDGTKSDQFLELGAHDESEYSED